jgi:hypothetical protein
MVSTRFSGFLASSADFLPVIVAFLVHFFVDFHRAVAAD